MSKELKYNGMFANCKLGSEDWSNFQQKQTEIANNLKNTHDLVSEHKLYLSNLEALPEIASILSEIKDQLLDAALGNKHIPLDVAKDLFQHSKSTSKDTSKTLFIVIIGLLTVLLFLLTGEKFGWIRELEVHF